jgi:hypothetical protein
MADGRVTSVNTGTIRQMPIGGKPDPSLMRRLLEVEGRGEKWDEVGVRVLGRAGV